MCDEPVKEDFETDAKEENNNTNTTQIQTLQRNDMKVVSDTTVEHAIDISCK